MHQTTAYKSPLHEMPQTTPTCLWNDSASMQELTYPIEHGAVGATCNPVIVVEVPKKEMHLWKERILQLIEVMPTATEEQVGWKLVEETSVKAAGRLAASREVAAIQGLFDLPLTSRQVIQGGIQIVRGLLSLLSGKAPKM